VRRIVALIVVVAAAAVIAGSNARLSRLESSGGTAQHLLYLPNGKYLKIASLGNAPLLADLIYLWSIQYYGNYQIEDRYKYVEHVYGSIITELDPHYMDPYWLGAMILSVETKNVDGAVALLDKGFANNPGDWVYPYLAGWECAYAKRFDCAIAHFREAAALEGAPPGIDRIVAGMYQREGDRSTSLAAWQRIALEATDPNVRKIALNQVRTLRRALDLDALRAAVARYREARGRLPGNLTTLVREGFLRGVPEGPDGEAYLYDPATGQVTAGSPGVIPR
jgi:tetratricopeptide (TPR) repeat protein